jgi:hypothetical protein
MKIRNNSRVPPGWRLMAVGSRRRRRRRGAASASILVDDKKLGLVIIKKRAGGFGLEAQPGPAWPSSLCLGAAFPVLARCFNLGVMVILE